MIFFEWNVIQENLFNDKRLRKTIQFCTFYRMNIKNMEIIENLLLQITECSVIILEILAFPILMKLLVVP